MVPLPVGVSGAKAVLARLARRCGVAAVALVSASAVVACCGVTNDDERSGPAIAEAIAGARSPLVERVTYNPGDFVDPPTIDVVMATGSSLRDAATVACAIVIPAMAAGSPPDGLTVWFLYPSYVPMNLHVDAGTSCPISDP